MDISGESTKLTDIITECGHPDDKWPILKRVWEMFTGKGIRTVCVSIGSSLFALPELEIVESLGCPLHIVPLTTAQEGEWAKVTQILKDRKREEATASSFSLGADTKWILPKNIRCANTIPYWTAGSVDISGATRPTVEAGAYMNSICSAIKMKDGAVRCDILKVDTASVAPGLERAILGSIFEAGFRPSIVIVRWEQMPDQHLPTTVAAAQLQMFGYHLFHKVDNKFMYYFNDNDLYQTCSWEDTTVPNPLVRELIRATATQMRPPTSLTQSEEA